MGLCTAVWYAGSYLIIFFVKVCSMKAYINTLGFSQVCFYALCLVFAEALCVAPNFFAISNLCFTHLKPHFTVAHNVFSGERFLQCTLWAADAVVLCDRFVFN